MRSAPTVRFPRWKKRAHLSSTPCVRKRAVSHHVFRGVQTCPLLSAGPRWARADAVWWSAAGTGERSPILLDGALVNAAPSVLPMVRGPLAASRLSYPFTEFFGFLLNGGHGGHFHSPPYQQSLSLCVYVCAVCASLAPVCEVSPASHVQ